MSDTPADPSAIVATGVLLAMCVIFVLGRYAFTTPSLVLVWAPAVAAWAVALLFGVPVWRDRPFGDAFDILFLTALVNSCALRFMIRWLA